MQRLAAASGQSMTSAGQTLWGHQFEVVRVWKANGWILYEVKSSHDTSLASPLSYIYDLKFH
jgi:hypothetical protein